MIELSNWQSPIKRSIHLYHRVVRRARKSEILHLLKQFFVIWDHTQWSNFAAIMRAKFVDVIGVCRSAVKKLLIVRAGTTMIVEFKLQR